MDNNEVLSQMLYATCPRGYVDDNGVGIMGINVGSGVDGDPIRTEYPGCWAVFVFDLHCASAKIVARLTNNQTDVWPHKLLGDKPIYEVKSITLGPVEEEV